MFTKKVLRLAVSVVLVLLSAFLVGTNTLLARDTGFLCRILASQLLEFDLVMQKSHH